MTILTMTLSFKFGGEKRELLSSIALPLSWARTEESLLPSLASSKQNQRKSLQLNIK